MNQVFVMRVVAWPTKPLSCRDRVD